MGWTEKANLRGPAGYNATNAVEDIDTLAAYAEERAGANGFRDALTDVIGRETRSIIEFIPRAQRAAVLAGNSTWDSSDRINYAIRELGGGRIKIPKGANLSIGKPIDLTRGSLLSGSGLMDNAVGVGSKITLLPGANCSMLRTPLAAGGAPTHFLALEDLIFDGNKDNQTVESTGVDFRGVWVGSFIKNVAFTKTFGTALRLGNGADINLSHIWVYNNDTAGYAMAINEDLTSGSDGLLQMDNIYIEHTGVGAKRASQFPKDNPTNRGKGLLINAPTQLTLDMFHSEGVSTPLTIKGSGQILNIGTVTSANIGNPDGPSAVVDFKDTASYIANIRSVKKWAATPNTKTITCSGAPSNEFLEVNDEYVNQWQYVRAGTAKSFLPRGTQVNNKLRIQRNGGFSGHGFEIADANGIGLSFEGSQDNEFTRVFSNNSGTRKELFSFRSKGGAIPGAAGVHEILASVPQRLADLLGYADTISDGSIYRFGRALKFRQGNANNTVVTVRETPNQTPSTNADHLGQECVDTVRGIAWKAVRVGQGADDWKQITP